MRLWNAIRICLRAPAYLTIRPNEGKKTSTSDENERVHKSKQFKIR